MAELGVGTLNMTITADGSAAVAEIDRVKSAAEGVQSSLSVSMSFRTIELN